MTDGWKGKNMAVIKYTDAFRTVVGKLKDTSNLSVETQAESILKSLGVVQTDHHFRTVTRTGECSVCGKYYHEHH
jgi:hypothetical protein